MSTNDRQRRVTHQVASLLLAYPDHQLLERIPLLRQAIATLPEHLGRPLRALVEHVERTPLDDLAAAYVKTFDLRRKSCLYLTYYLYGDTRKRGAALLRFKHAYARAGLPLGQEELPDHLAVVLEFSAVGDAEAAGRLLRDHRAGLELLWHALRDCGSPYAGVVEAVRATLPEPGARDLAAALRLARQGPPAEEVGLEPYAMVMEQGGGKP